jgi:multidrug resistance efflux pump
MRPAGAPLALEPVLAAGSVQVKREELTVWSRYVGKLEPRSPVTVMSKARTAATLIDIVPDGSKVAKGDVLARLNAAVVEREVVKAEKDYALAESELNAFRSAKAPLEIQEFNIKAMEARSAFDAENAYLKAMRKLQADGLVSGSELDRQVDKVNGLRTQMEKADMQLRLTREQLHPAEIRRAQARVAAAESELRLARQEMQETVIRASAAGVVIYTYLYFGPELRTVRLGDNISANQPFMTIYDMKDLVVECEVPEAELGKAQPGSQSLVQPVAFPDVRIPGVIDRISPVVANVPGRPSWQKAFMASVRLTDFDTRLRPGMSVVISVLSTHKEHAITIPRLAVRWNDGKASVDVVDSTGRATRDIRVGVVNERSYEVLDGLREGESVAVP